MLEFKSNGLYLKVLWKYYLRPCWLMLIHASHMYNWMFNYFTFAFINQILLYLIWYFPQKMFILQMKYFTTLEYYLKGGWIYKRGKNRHKSKKTRQHLRKKCLKTREQTSIKNTTKKSKRLRNMTPNYRWAQVIAPK